MAKQEPAQEAGFLLPIHNLLPSPHAFCLGLFYWCSMKNLKAALLAAGMYRFFNVFF
jgi:hypothetical protein